MMLILRYVLRGAICLLLMARPAMAEPVTVFAAASLGSALDEVAQGFGGEVVLSYAGSSALARQVQLGAPADLVILANTDWMDLLQRDGLIAVGTRIDLLGNRLVLAGPAGARPIEIGPDLDLPGMLGEGRLAMALVEAVPAGIYGKAALESLGLWGDVQARVAQTDNVRAALALISVGQVPLGVVYATDAMADPRVAILGEFPQSSHSPIRYPVAAVAGRAARSADFLAYLTGPEARAVFVAHGFAVLHD